VLGCCLMSDTTDLPETTDDTVAPERPKADPIDSRFLFVDIAAMRAKQLRRGALPRISDEDLAETHRALPHKAERVAMEEVRRGLVLYDVTQPKPSTE
jgi:DNA-directed RNA polymerase subunit K/omega